MVAQQLQELGGWWTIQRREYSELLLQGAEVEWGGGGGGFPCIKISGVLKLKRFSLTAMSTKFQESENNKGCFGNFLK